MSKRTEKKVVFIGFGMVCKHHYNPPNPHTRILYSFLITAYLFDILDCDQIESLRLLQSIYRLHRAFLIRSEHLHFLEFTEFGFLLRFTCNLLTIFRWIFNCCGGRVLLTLCFFLFPCSLVLLWKVFISVSNESPSCMITVLSSLRIWFTCLLYVLPLQRTNAILYRFFIRLFQLPVCFYLEWSN